MQHATLPGSDSACGTGNGRYLCGREFFPFHLDRMRQHPAAKPFNFRTLSVLATTHWGAKTLADFEINDIAALPPLLCYNSYLCFDSSACASERWFASCAPVGASYSRIWLYVNNSPS